MFWKNWPTKLIPLADTEELKTVLLSTLIYLLCHKYCEVTDEGKDGRDGKLFFYFIKISWKYIGLMLKFE